MIVRGDEFDDCLGTDEHESWAAGWRATCDLDEDDDPQSNRIDVSSPTD